MKTIVAPPAKARGLGPGIARFVRIQGSQTSTWRGVVILLTAAGASLTPESSNAIIATGLAVSGLLGVLLGDKVPGSTGDAAGSPSSE